MNGTLKIRKSLPGDLTDILVVEEKAFNYTEEAKLDQRLLANPSAEPRLSLLAFIDDQPAGQIIFSKADFNPAINVVGLLAVVPHYQRMGIGG